MTAPSISQASNVASAVVGREPPETVGLVAAWGEYPLIVARGLKAQGFRICCLGVASHADPALGDICDTFRTMGPGRLGAAIRHFRRHGVRRATMVGKFHKVRIYQPWFIARCLPDLRTLRAFYPYFGPPRKDRKDDTLLSVLIREFARDGIAFVPPTDFLPELLVQHEKLTRRAPTTSQRKDIEFGWEIARAMGGLDIGQTIAVKGRAVLAVEAIEGTDECIRRAGQLCAAGGFTVIKVAKPRQDMRFDVPTVGINTVRNIVAAGGRCLAIEAGRTILLNREEVADFADRHGLCIVALPTSGACVWQEDDAAAA